MQHFKAVHRTWNYRQTATAFVGSVLSLGALIVGLIAVAFGYPFESLISLLAGLIVSGLIIEAVSQIFHSRALKRKGDEGAASHYSQRTKFGYPWLIRNSLLCANIIAAIVISQTGLQGVSGLVFGSLFALSLLSSAFIGRPLFYTIVIPTTLPGGFFWKNQGFVEHARETGLSDMPQLGVTHERHHKFNWRALLKTVGEIRPG